MPPARPSCTPTETWPALAAATAAAFPVIILSYFIEGIRHSIAKSIAALSVVLAVEAPARALEYRKRMFFYLQSVHREPPTACPVCLEGIDVNAAIPQPPPEIRRPSLVSISRRPGLER